MALSVSRSLLPFLWLALPLTAVAQQTIFDVPSADVAPARGWFYQHQTVARTWTPGRRWIQTNALGFGVGHALELDATWFNLDAKTGDSVGSAGFKWSPRLNAEDARVPLRLVLGDLVQAQTKHPRLGNWAYAMVSVELPSHTHITGGVSSGTSILFGEKTTGVLAGVEHHLNHRWMLQADWFSGRHRIAFLHFSQQKLIFRFAESPISCLFDIYQLMQV